MPAATTTRREPPDGVSAIKRRVGRLLTNRLMNPMVLPLLERELLPPIWAILETRGRKTGQPRRVPVGNGLRGETFWIVTEHGYGASYVRNIEADPRVRVKVGRRWYEGVAHLLSDDDPYARLRQLRRPLNDAALLLMGTQQLTIRVDLQQETHA